jgi:hypothetical protein
MVSLYIRVPKVTKTYPIICYGMKISHFNMIEQNQTHGVLDRIITVRREAELYFVTLMPAMKEPEADRIITTEMTYSIGVSFISRKALAMFSRYPETQYYFSEPPLPPTQSLTYRKNGAMMTKYKQQKTPSIPTTKLGSRE